MPKNHVLSLNLYLDYLFPTPSALLSRNYLGPWGLGFALRGVAPDLFRVEGSGFWGFGCGV